jgi:formate-dependent nitrite reductase membrane component NrfD
LTTDGRDINLNLAELSGEGSLQRVRPGVSKAWTGPPVPDAADPAAPPAGDPTYYGRPLLKEPVWKWMIPAYYFVGGAAGASLVIGAAAQLDRSGKLDHLMRRCHWTGVIGSALSGGLLILDLGKPARFHHMLRVFRPTSPMNMGVWVISAVAPSAMVAALFGNRRGFLGKIGDVSGIAAGLAGLALSTYTGVLIANTAVPVWQESRRILPILFAASAMASAGSIFDLAFEDPRARRVTYTFGTIGRVAELAASLALERQVARIDPKIARPLNTGCSGMLWKTAAVMTGASLALSLLPGKSRKKRLAAGILGTLGSLVMRYGIHHAGVASARDPRAAFRQQRSGEGTS